LHFRHGVRLYRAAARRCSQIGCKPATMSSRGSLGDRGREREHFSTPTSLGRKTASR
jgi:hypothetical protein